MENVQVPCGIRHYKKLSAIKARIYRCRLSCDIERGILVRENRRCIFRRWTLRKRIFMDKREKSRSVLERRTTNKAVLPRGLAEKRQKRNSYFKCLGSLWHTDSRILNFKGFSFGRRK